jgi:starvation-inducible DNA-binding protein
MHKTRNDLPKPTRAKMIELLNARLADAIDLYAQAKQAHWNVKGTDFFQLHELFDKVAEAVEEGVDELAERAGVGGADGTFSRSSCDTLAPTGQSKSGSDVDRVSRASRPTARTSRRDRHAGDAGDADVGLFTEFRAGGQAAWFVECTWQRALRV